MIRVLALLLALTAPAMAEEERGIVLLTGNVWAEGARQSIAGRAMVCPLPSPESFLSLRTGPNADTTEILKLSDMTIVELTGETEGSWARVAEVVVEVAQDGNLLPEASQGSLKIDGWLHTDYLCNYMY